MQQDLDKKTGERTTQLVDKLRQAFGEQLVSVCVYGSSLVTPETGAKTDAGRDINVLVILEQLEPVMLQHAAPIVSRWEKQAHALPIFLSRAEWEQSADIFALEYADIRDHHHVAYGEDLYSGVEIHRDALRLVCELELNRKLILLRQRMLVSAEKPAELAALLQDSITSFATLFRGILRLESEHVPQTPAEVFEHLPAVVSGFDPQPFLRVLAGRQSDGDIAKSEASELFHRYLSQIDRVNTYVNQHFTLTFEEARV